MGVTIKDVARFAGVSTATVSYVINNSRFVSGPTREKVEYALARLCYSPNTLARSLRVGNSRTVGMVVPQISNPSFTDAIHGVEKVLRKNAYTLLISESDEDWRTEIEAIKVFNSMFVAGVVIMVSGKKQSMLKEALDSGSYPVVFLDRRPDEIEGDVVTLDNVKSTREATALLLEKGRSKIGLLVGPRHSITKDRVKGYVQAHVDRGLRVDETLIRYGDYSIEAGRELGGELIDRCGVTAFFAASEDMTLGAFLAVKARGLRIPDQVALIGCHDSSWANAVEPALTMVSQPSSELGRISAELLLKRIKAPGREFEAIYLPTQLNIRGSI